MEHDGDLGGNASVSMRASFDDVYIYVPPMAGVALYPSQALSLLSWLEQERENLERLAQKQGQLL